MNNSNALGSSSLIGDSVILDSGLEHSAWVVGSDNDG